MASVKPWLILPIKAFDSAKKRLGEHLNVQQRQQLAQAMLLDMLAQLAAFTEDFDIVLISKDAAVAAIAEQMHCQFLLEPTECTTLNHAVSYAVAQAEKQLVRQVFILHGDLPLIQQEDIRVFLQHAEHTPLVLVPDEQQNGTNAIALRLPSEFVFSYGEQSFAKHCAIAKTQQLAYSVLMLDSFAVDIDFLDDFLHMTTRLHETSHVGQLLSAKHWPPIDKP